MKKIITIIESIGSGGAERQLTGLAVLLKKQGYDVEVWYYVKDEFYMSFLQKNNVNVRFLSDATNRYYRLFALKKHLHSFNPDVVISYSTSSSMITCLLKRLGARFYLLVSERNTTQKTDFRERLKFFLYKWADYIVPNSYSQGNYIKKFFPNLSSKTTIITNFVDTNYFSPLEEKEKNPKCKMICVGRVFPQKNVLLFLEVVKVLKEKGVKLSIDWYGRTEGEYAEQCINKLEALQLNHFFSFKGAVEDIRDEYRKADVFCLPSLYEGFPNVLCEAMSCGLPVLCSRVCDNPNIAKEGDNGYLFDPENVVDMATAILSFLKLDDDSRKVMGQRSREIALSLFSSDVFVKKYLDIIRNNE